MNYVLGSIIGRSDRVQEVLLGILVEDENKELERTVKTTREGGEFRISMWIKALGSNCDDV